MINKLNKIREEINNLQYNNIIYVNADDVEEICKSLSKDAAATEESIKITQHMLEQYFSGDTHCKIDFSL